MVFGAFNAKSWHRSDHWVMWANLIFDATGGLFLATSLAGLRDLRWVHRLPAFELLAPINPSTLDHHRRLRCSVVIAARDEEARIEQAIRHLLRQRDIELEIIVVDDRSTDRTSENLQRLAKEESRLIPRRVENLPEGWLGKCHACHLGATSATGDWILFTDADCWLAPDVIVRAIRVAQNQKADHVTLTAGTDVKNLRIRGWYLLFLISLLNWIAGVNRDRRGSYFGIGAFNLVDAKAYRQCGGYEALRLTILDDIKLGLLLQRSGKRTRAFLGTDDVKCHWSTTLRGMVRIMEKNYFAALGYRLWLVGLSTFAMLLAFGTILAGLLSGTVSGVVPLLALCSFTLPGAILARRLGWPAWSAIGIPFMFPVLFYSLLNSTWVTMRQGGVRWRDTFYPLDSLRKGEVR